MADNESHAGITAEIRARAKAWMSSSIKQYDERLADRLDAAHKLEVDTLAQLAEDLRSQRDMWYDKSKKLRLALEYIAHYDDNEEQMDDPGCGDGHILAEKAREALGITKEREVQHGK